MEFNLDHSALTRLKSVNKMFYGILNPNEYRVNRIWELICRHKYELIPSRLKCKRWDLYYKYRIEKLKDAEKRNYEHQECQSLVYPRSDKQFVNIIENCDYDINNINNQYHVKIIGNKIIKKKEVFDDLKEDEIFKGDIGSNGLPKGFKGKLKCPMILAGNWNFLNYVENGKFYCKECHKNVYTVTTLDEMKTKLNQTKCVRIVYYHDGLIMEEEGEEDEESNDDNDGNSVSSSD